MAEHYSALAACAETLVQLRLEAQYQADAATFAVCGAGLRRAVILATWHRDSANAVRWESEACELERLAGEGGAPVLPGPLELSAWQTQSGWQTDPARPWGFGDLLRGASLAGIAVWSGCGIQRRNGSLTINPKRGNAWQWWALLDLPYEDGRISLVWDGTTLYATRPLSSSRPVQLCSAIRVLRADELDFDLQFELVLHPVEDGAAERRVFHPEFERASRTATAS